MCSKLFIKACIFLPKAKEFRTLLTQKLQNTSMLIPLMVYNYPLHNVVSVISTVFIVVRVTEAPPSK